jgi:hypothetical protein
MHAPDPCPTARGFLLWVFFSYNFVLFQIYDAAEKEMREMNNFKADLKSMV